MMKTQWNKRGYVTILRYPTILIFLNLFLIFLFLNLGWVFVSGEKFGFLINITQHQIYKVFLWFISFTEAVVQRCSVKKVFACNFIKKETLTQAFSCEFCEISNNTFSYRTPLVAASTFIITNTLVLHNQHFSFASSSIVQEITQQQKKSK